MSKSSELYSCVEGDYLNISIRVDTLCHQIRDELTNRDRTLRIVDETEFAKRISRELFRVNSDGRTVVHPAVFTAARKLLAEEDKDVAFYQAIP